MAIDVKQYIEQLAQSAGLSDEERAGILKVASNDKFSTALGADIMRQQDYSRNMDAVAAEKKKTGDYYQQLLAWKAEQDAQPIRTEPVVGEYMTKAEMAEQVRKFEATQKQQEQSFITIAKVMGRLSSQHAVEFKEALDVDALEKIAIDKQLPLPQAYELLVSPRRTELAEKSFAERLAQAKEEGKREFASTHQIPIDSTPRESPYGRPSFDRAADKGPIPDYVPNSGQLSATGTRNLREGFVEEWTKAGAAPQGT